MKKINPVQSFYELLADTASSHPKETALVYFSHKISYQKLLSRVNQFAQGLVLLGVNKGDCVTLVLPNIPEAVYLLYAINQIGAISNPLFPTLPVNDIQSTIRKTGSKLIFCLSSRYNEISSIKGTNVFAIDPSHELPLIKRMFVRNPHASNMLNFYNLKKCTLVISNPFDDAFYLNSGGTSGIPKIVRLSSFAMNSLSENVPYILEGTGIDYFKMLCVLPFFHGFGLGVGLHFPLSYGSICVLMPKFNRRMATKYIRKDQVSITIGIPILYRKLLKYPGFAGKKLQNLDFAFVGGDYVDRTLLERFNSRMEEAGSKCRLYQGYGLTETMSLFSVNVFSHHQDGTVGKPLPNVSCKVIDEYNKEVATNINGQLIVTGNTLMNGYLEEGNPFIDLDGVRYVLTGDNCSINDDGYIVYNQRIKRILKISGISIFPHEIEDIVKDFDFVYECAAIGVDDSAHATVVKLFIVLHKHFSGTIIEAESKIREKIKNSIGIYANPKEIVFLEKMPHTSVGKIDYKKLH